MYCHRDFVLKKEYQKNLAKILMTHQIWALQNYKDYLIETIQQMLQRGPEMTRTWRFKIFELYHWCSVYRKYCGFFVGFSLWEHLIAMNDKSWKHIHSCYITNVTYYMLIRPSLPGPSKVILTKGCDTFAVPRRHVMVLVMKWQNWELEGNCGEKWIDCVWGEKLRTVSSWQQQTSV